MAKKKVSAPAQPYVPLEVEITNFGPISKGKFKIKPLTIFVGPNNSGKTYAATLAHSLLGSPDANLLPWGFEDWLNTQSKQSQFQKLVSGMNKIVSSTPRSKELSKVPVAHSNKIYDLTLTHIFGNHFFNTLKTNFSSELRDLVRIGSRSSTIQVTHPIEAKISIFKTKPPAIKLRPHNIQYAVKHSPKSAPIIKLHDHHTQPKNHVDFIDRLVYDDLHFLSPDLKLSTNLGLSALVSLMLHMSYSFDTSLHKSYYLPAARAGILSSSNTIASSIIQSAKYGGADLLHIEQFNGVVSDFIASLIGTTRKQQPASQKSAITMMEEMFGGRISVSKQKIGLPRFSFKIKGINIPLNRSSSSITETVPLQLFIQKRLPYSDLIIIEEPEAHLHPANQTKLAKHIIRLINSGVCVLLTTHSVFFLEQLSMFVKMSKLKPEQRKKLGYDVNDYIDDDYVAPYTFKSDSCGGYTIHEMDHSAAYGIPQDEFNRVTEIMYEEDLKIDQYLEQ